MKSSASKIISGKVKEFIKSVIQTLPIAVTRNQKYDHQTLQVMKRLLKADSNCIDVGCHKGDVLKFMLDYSPNGTHYAFEPIPDLFENLISHFPSNCRFHQVGLSDSIGEAPFNYVISNPAYSGFEKRSYDSVDERDTKIIVNTDLLDNIIPEDHKIDFIKIDVEGAELNVLKGGILTIKRNKPVIVFEHGLGAADYYKTKPDDIYDILNGICGLRISLMENWLKDKKPLNKEEFKEQFYKKLNYYFIAY